VTGEFIVYPAHGVGQIVAIQEQEVAGPPLVLPRVGRGGGKNEKD
jgi:RNA polymerase-interacting CarD/CdnL/TRCF family regulator